MAARRRAPTLAQLIRRSPLLDAAARRRWLDVLPHLTEDDQTRLREILTADAKAGEAGAGGAGSRAGEACLATMRRESDAPYGGQEAAGDAG